MALPVAAVIGGVETLFPEHGVRVVVVVRSRALQEVVVPGGKKEKERENERKQEERRRGRRGGEQRGRMRGRRRGRRREGEGEGYEEGEEEGEEEGRVCVSIVSSAQSSHYVCARLFKWFTAVHVVPPYTVHHTQYIGYILFSLFPLFSNPYLSPWQIASPSHLFWNSTQKGMPSH